MTRLFTRPYLFANLWFQLLIINLGILCCSAGFGLRARSAEPGPVAFTSLASLAAPIVVVLSSWLTELALSQWPVPDPGWLPILSGIRLVRLSFFVPDCQTWSRKTPYLSEHTHTLAWLTRDQALRLFHNRWTLRPREARITDPLVHVLPHTVDSKAVGLLKSGPSSSPVF